MRKTWTLISFIVFLSLPLWSHKGEKHKETASSKAQEVKLKQINAAYVQEIRPIFKKKCFDCHATAERFPWYYKVPGIKQLMQYDIREAQEHLDMRQDFPFVGHGYPLADLQEIEEVLEEGSMPPWYYRIMHRGSALTAEEIKKITKWTVESKEILK